MWPLKTHDRLIGLPFAVDLRDGPVLFHVTPYDHASSLLHPQEGAGGGAATPINTQAIRLERVIRSIPSHLRIQYLKTDCQGKDLEVRMHAWVLCVCAGGRVCLFWCVRVRTVCWLWQWCVRSSSRPVCYHDIVMCASPLHLMAGYPVRW